MIDLAILWDAAEVTRRFEGDAFAAERATRALVTATSRSTAQSLDVRVRLRRLSLEASSAARDEATAALVRGEVDLVLAFAAPNDRTPDMPDMPVGVLSSEAAFGRIAMPETLGDAAAVAWCTRAIAIASGAQGEPDFTDGRLDDASIADIWRFLDQLDRGVLGGSESGVLAAADLRVAAPGSHHAIAFLEDDDRTNCGPLAVEGVDPMTDGGLPLDRGFDAEGRPIVSLWIPPGSSGLQRLRYRIALANAPEDDAAPPPLPSEASITIRIPDADLNRDGRIDAEDIAILLERWGDADPTSSRGDLDGSGRIDAGDLASILIVCEPQEDASSPADARRR